MKRKLVAIILTMAFITGILSSCGKTSSRNNSAYNDMFASKANSSSEEIESTLENGSFENAQSEESSDNNTSGNGFDWDDKNPNTVGNSVYAINNIEGRACRQGNILYYFVYGGSGDDEYTSLYASCLNGDYSPFGYSLNGEDTFISQAIWSGAGRATDLNVIGDTIYFQSTGKPEYNSDGVYGTTKKVYKAKRTFKENTTALYADSETSYESEVIMDSPISEKTENGIDYNGSMLVVGNYLVFFESASYWSAFFSSNDSGKILIYTTEGNLVYEFEPEYGFDKILYADDSKIYFSKDCDDNRPTLGLDECDLPRLYELDLISMETKMILDYYELEAICGSNMYINQEEGFYYGGIGDNNGVKIRDVQTKIIGIDDNLIYFTDSESGGMVGQMNPDGTSLEATGQSVQKSSGEGFDFYECTVLGNYLIGQQKVNRNYEFAACNLKTGVTTSLGTYY